MRVYAESKAESDMFFYGTTDTKKIKRIERKVFGIDARYKAFSMGEFQALSGQPKHNPFPPGKRHDSFEHGFNLLG